ncbi:MAG: CHASE2 domain-containing protein, partial [Gallionellaceae bacterium]|nr:CHASE2 domain-containing protein [Gallionellaceae bacterium]
MKDFRKTLHILTALFALLTVIELGWLHGFLPLENHLSDRFVRMQAQRLQPDPQIVIVDIDDASLARMQDVAGNWPWPRAVHGELVRGIAKQRPAAIVFDILFTESDQYRPESDRLFNEALDVDSKVYFPLVRRDPALDASGAPIEQVAPLLGLQRTGEAKPDARIALLPPLAIDTRFWRTGTINFAEDRDGVGRRYQLYTPAYGWLIPSLPARVAADLGYAVPVQNDFMLAWRGKAGSFQHVSYVDLYEDFNREKPKRQQDEFSGKIVIIGTAATGLHDLRVTPLSSLHPGMEILATALDNLKNGYMTRAAPTCFLL